MKKITDKELLVKVRTELNEEICWLNHHIEWLKNELKNSQSTYYIGLLEAYVEVKLELTRIASKL